jgi:hypothetical protein
MDDGPRDRAPGRCGVSGLKVGDRVRIAQGVTFLGGRVGNVEAVTPDGYVTVRGDGFAGTVPAESLTPWSTLRESLASMCEPQPVDVLAVMDAAVIDAEKLWVHRAPADLREARAAVAELIAAARGYADTAPCDCSAPGCGAADCYGQRHDDARVRLSRALARAGGAS